MTSGRVSGERAFSPFLAHPFCNMSLFCGFFFDNNSSGKKKEPKPKLFGPDVFRWGGGLPRARVGAKKFGMSLETRETKLFGGISRDFAGISRTCPKCLRKKGLCSIFVPQFRIRDLMLSYPHPWLNNICTTLSFVMQDGLRNPEAFGETRKLPRSHTPDQTFIPPKTISESFCFEGFCVEGTSGSQTLQKRRFCSRNYT